MTDAPDQSKDSIPERGVNRIARDFDRALAILAATGGVRAFVMEQAREESWTRAVATARKGTKANDIRPLAFRLDAGRMAAILNTSRSSVYDAVKWLVDARVLTPEADGTMRINTQYAAWVAKDGTPLLTPGQVEWCREATDFRMFRGLSVTTDKRKFVRYNVQTCPVQRAQLSGTTDKAPVTTDNRTIEERTRNSAESREAEQQRAAAEDLEPFEAKPQPLKIATPTAAPFTNDQAEVDRVVGLAEKFDQATDLYAVVGRLAKSYRIEWIERALHLAMTDCKDAKWRGRYIVKILDDWKLQNGPPKPKPDPHAATTPRYVPFAPVDPDEPPVRIKGVDPNKVRPGNIARCLPTAS